MMEMEKNSTPFQKGGLMNSLRTLLIQIGFLVLLTQTVLAQGPVVLMGIGAEDGGPGTHGPITVYENVIRHILDQATSLGNTGSGILVLGGGKNASDDVTRFWNQIGIDLGVSVVFANGATNIATKPLSGFKLAAIVSTFPGTTGGGWPQAENDALTNRRSDIPTFVKNQHGGFLAFSQADLNNAY